MLLLSQIIFFVAAVAFIFSLVCIMIIPEDKLRETGEGTQLFWLFVVSVLIMAMNVSSVLSDSLVSEYLVQ